MAKSYGPSRVSSVTSAQRESGYSGTTSSPSLPKSMKEAGECFASLVHRVEKLENERDQFHAQNE